MATHDITRETRFHWAERQLTWLYILAIAIHGPVDIVLTGIAWHLESNPIVLQLGAEYWLIAKVLVVIAASIVFLDSLQPNPDEYPVCAAAWLGVFVGLGLALILPNILILAGVIDV